MQQAFAEVSGAVGQVDLGARWGRQEFTDGPNLLVSQRDNNTIRYTLNGWRAWARLPTMRADVFDLKPTQYGDLGTDDDVIDPARRFSGVTLGFVVPKDWFGGSKLYVDPLLSGGGATASAPGAGGSGRRRAIISARTSGARPGR
ncbi:alginate export family protein [Sphingomonas sp. MMS24-JH45]